MKPQELIDAIRASGYKDFTEDAEIVENYCGCPRCGVPMAPNDAFNIATEARDLDHFNTLLHRQLLEHLCTECVPDGFKIFKMTRSRIIDAVHFTQPGWIAKPIKMTAAQIKALLELDLTAMLLVDEKRQEFEIALPNEQPKKKEEPMKQNAVLKPDPEAEAKPDLKVMPPPTKEEKAKAARYLELNQHIKRLTRSHFELCDLLHEMDRDELYLHAPEHYKNMRAWATAELGLGYSTITLYREVGRTRQVIEASDKVGIKPSTIRQIKPLISLKDEDVVKVWLEGERVLNEENVTKPGKNKAITERIIGKAKANLFGKGPEPTLKDYQRRLNTAVKAIWSAWPADKKDAFVETLYDRMLDYGDMLVMADFKDQKFGDWVKKMAAEAKK